MRIIDADELLKGRTDHEMISTHLIFNAPTVDVLEQIRAEIEQLHYHPKLDFIKNDDVVDMALEIVDKYREEQTDAT